MQEDIESTEAAFAIPKKMLSHPALIYVEMKSGNIAPVIVTKSDYDYTEHFWDNRTVRRDGRFKFVKDVLLIAPGSQAEGKLFIRENASDEDIARVLGQMKKNRSLFDKGKIK